MIITFLLHAVIGIAVIGCCLAAPAGLAIFLARATFVMPELDAWWRAEQRRMLESSTRELAAELEPIMRKGGSV